MSTAEMQNAEIAQRLRLFLNRATALRRSTTESSPAGLLLFLQKARPLLCAIEPLSPKPTRSALQVGNISAAVSRLQKPLRDARGSDAALNVWAITGLRRNEVRNSAVLAWFLDPRGSHGLGAGVLTAFLDSAMRAAPDWPDLARDFSRVSVQTEEWPLGSETDRVDIALDGPDFAIFVEVKIDAPEGPNQLCRYAQLAQVKASALGKTHGRVIYLSSRHPVDTPLGVALVTWRMVARILSNLPGRSMSNLLARQFAHHVSGFSKRR